MAFSGISGMYVFYETFHGLVCLELSACVTQGTCQNRPNRSLEGRIKSKEFYIRIYIYIERGSMTHMILACNECGDNEENRESFNDSSG
jgi:hypothetical protein